MVALATEARVLSQTGGRNLQGSKSSGWYQVVLVHMPALMWTSRAVHLNGRRR